MKDAKEKFFNAPLTKKFFTSELYRGAAKNVKYIRAKQQKNNRLFLRIKYNIHASVRRWKNFFKKVIISALPDRIYNERII